MLVLAWIPQLTFWVDERGSRGRGGGEGRACADRLTFATQKSDRYIVQSA